MLLQPEKFQTSEMQITPEMLDEKTLIFMLLMKLMGISMKKQEDEGALKFGKRSDNIYPEPSQPFPMGGSYGGDVG